MTRDIAFAVSAAPVLPAFPPSDVPPLSAREGRSGTSAWKLSGWLFVRDGGGRQLAAGGVLGGSQAGARITYGISSTVALSARAYAPLGDADGAEVALGLEWQPDQSVPMRLLVERRQAIGGKGRSAFAIQAYGGISDRPVVGPIKLDAYAQGGLVGLQSRDPFVDGSVRLKVSPANRTELGLSAWGAAQPGASRVDVGPEASYRLPLAGARLSASYRVRVAGDARPGSGPALTLSTDF